jgi:membrane-anchored protein YejM (alkaline phosphatase superfamily)
VPRYVRVLTFIPYLIVLLFLVVIAMKVGWVFFFVSFAIWLLGSLLFGTWLIRRSRRRRAKL